MVTLNCSYPPALASTSRCPNPTTHPRTREVWTHSEGSASSGIREGRGHQIQMEISSPGPSLTLWEDSLSHPHPKS